MLSLKNNPLFQSFEEAGQAHVFRFWDKLDASERVALEEQAAEIDLQELSNLCDVFLSIREEGVSLEGDLSPPECIELPCDPESRVAWGQAKVEGMRVLRAGKVAVLTVAGGCGTRLGFSGPKGCFPVTPVKKKPLFQVFAEKIRAAEARYGVLIPWFLMTSVSTDAATRAFFQEHDYFGLNKESVYFFEQGRMPSIDFEGKIIMEAAGRIAMSPDGHGGVFNALRNSRCLDIMESKGIDVISYHQVDNPLARIIDPYFIGWHTMKGSEMSSKMVRKVDPEEKVGLFCDIEGRLNIVEYSDFPEGKNVLRDNSGALRFRAANPAIHLIDVGFARKLASAERQLPFHRAVKAIACLNESGVWEKPSEPNGLRFERFVFDALPVAERALLLEIDRSKEFSPVKNASGKDSVETSIRDQNAVFAEWIHAVNGGSVRGSWLLEVSPLFTESKNCFLKKWKSLEQKPPIRDGFYLE